MRTLVFSDLHVGDARLRNEDDIVELLKKEDYDRLLLNGDIVDCWMLGYRRAVRESKVIDAIVDIARDIPVIWVAGNHDPVKADQHYIPGAKVFNMYRFDKHFLALHGHQVYPFYDQAWYSKILANIHSWGHRLFKLDFQTMMRDNPLYEERTRRKREEIIDNFGNPGDNILMGHTHLTGTQYKDGKHIHDSGSIMLDGTYLIIEDGKVYHKIIGE